MTNEELIDALRYHASQCPASADEDTGICAECAYEIAEENRWRCMAGLCNNAAGAIEALQAKLDRCYLALWRISDGSKEKVDVDAVPVVHGEWKRHPDWYVEGYCGYECSVCGMGSDVDYPYCMRCGAKMN